MSRLKKLEPSQWNAELRSLFKADEATPLEQGLMRMFAHRPAIAKGIIALGAGIQSDWTLSERLKELVRLRIAYHNQCRSCMAIRYRTAVKAGVTEDLVCSLEKPVEAPDLMPDEKAALAYADKFATDHYSIDDTVFKNLHNYFTDGQIVELGTWVAFCVGFGRFGAVMDMVEELPEAFQDKSLEKVTPWSGEPVIVR